MDQISPPRPPPQDSQPARGHYLFHLRHYETNEYALAGATMFAAWTMARKDFLGIEGNEFFIQVTANERQDYSEFVTALHDQFRERGFIEPVKPPELQDLVSKGLDLSELLSKYPPLPAPPMRLRVGQPRVSPPFPEVCLGKTKPLAGTKEPVFAINKGLSVANEDLLEPRKPSPRQTKLCLSQRKLCW